MLSFQFAVNKNISVLSYSPFLSFIKFDCWAFTLEHPVTENFQYIKKLFSHEYNGKGYLSIQRLGARFDFICTKYLSAGASLFGVRVIARMLLAAPAISIEPLVR